MRDVVGGGEGDKRFGVGVPGACFDPRLGCALDDQDVFAARFAAFVEFYGVAERRADDLFVDLRQFAAERDLPLRPEESREVGERVFQFVRRLVKDHRSSLVLHLGEPFVPLVAIGRKKSLEGKAPGRERRERQRRDSGAAARHDRDADPALRSKPHDILAGVADRGHSRVGHQRRGVSRRHAVENNRAALALVVFKITDQFLFDPEAGEQFSRVAGVLRRDEIDLGQDFLRPVGEIREVADRCGDEIERSRFDPVFLSRFSDALFLVAHRFVPFSFASIPNPAGKSPAARINCVSTDGASCRPSR